MILRSIRNRRTFIEKTCAVITRSAVLIALSLVSTILGAHGQGAERGLAFARANCARCHSVDRSSESPLQAAPPFRSLHKRYRVEALAEAFAEGVTTGHPAMPEFTLTPAQIGDLLSFLKTLE
jgi:cytochrome c